MNDVSVLQISKCSPGLKPVKNLSPQLYTLDHASKKGKLKITAS